MAEGGEVPERTTPPEPTLKELGVNFTAGREPFVHRGRTITAEGTPKFMALIRAQIQRLDTSRISYPDGATVSYPHTLQRPETAVRDMNPQLLQKELKTTSETNAGSLAQVLKTSSGIVIEPRGGAAFRIQDGRLEPLYTPSDTDETEKRQVRWTYEPDPNEGLLVITGVHDNLPTDYREIEAALQKAPEEQKVALEQALGIDSVNSHNASAVVFDCDRMPVNRAFAEHVQDALTAVTN